MSGLFDPIEINGLRLKNRMVMAPMAGRMATPAGEVTDNFIKHYAARARGGVGLIITEHTYISPKGKMRLNQLGLYDDKLIPGLKRLVDAVHQEGARLAIQLNHGGSATNEEITGAPPAGPWNIQAPKDAEASRPLTIPEIKEIIQAFSKAARWAVEAGFDAVEVHGAHGYLLGQFLSPYTNQRNDKYGGSTENRLRFPLEVISAVKKTLAGKIPLFYRFGADDMIEGGLTIDEAKLIAPRLVQAGINVIDVSGGLVGDGHNQFSEQGYFVPLAQSIKETVTVPVIGVGNITEPEYADAIVRQGKVDLVAFGRIMLSNPDFPKLAAQKLGITID